MSFLAASKRLDVLLGGIETERGRADAPTRLQLDAKDIFVDVVKLPAHSIAEARAAVALQIDRLCPIDPQSAIVDVIALNGEPFALGGQPFAIAVASRAGLASARDAAGKRARGVTLFSATVEAGGETLQALFRDDLAAKVRRNARLGFLGSLLALVAAAGVAGQQLDRWAARQETAGLALTADARANGAALARDTATAQARLDAMTAGVLEDPTARMTRLLAALSSPPIAGVAIDEVRVTARDIAFSATATSADGVRDAIEARSIRVSRFASMPLTTRAGGAKIDARLALPAESAP